MNEQPNNLNSMGQPMDPNMQQPMMNQSMPQAQPIQQPMPQQPVQQAMPQAQPVQQPMMQPMYDPNTGQPLTAQQPAFDPNTGQPIGQPVQQPMMQPMYDPNTGQPLMQQPVAQATEGNKLKVQGKAGGMIGGALISIIVFGLAFDFLIIPFIVKAISDGLELSSTTLLMNNPTKYANNLALYLFLAFFIRYGSVVLIALLTSRNSFRKKYLVPNDQKSYIIGVSAFLGILNVIIIAIHFSIINDFINTINVYESVEFVGNIISKCKMMQVFNVLIGIVATVLAALVVARVTKKRNNFINQ